MNANPIPLEAIQHAPDANILQTAWQHEHHTTLKRLALEHACAQNEAHEAAIAAQFEHERERRIAQAVAAARTTLEHEQCLYDDRLDKSGTRVLQVLVALGHLAKNHSGNTRNDGYFFADYRTLATLAGVSKRSVERTLGPSSPAYDLVRRFAWWKSLNVEHPDGGMSPAGSLFRVRTGFQVPGDKTLQPGADQRAFAATWYDWQMSDGGSLAVSRAKILNPVQPSQPESLENPDQHDNRQKKADLNTFTLSGKWHLRIALEGIDVQLLSETALKSDNRQKPNRYRNAAWWIREQGIQSLASTIMERLNDHRDSAPFWRGMAAKIVIEREVLGDESRQGPLENAVWKAVGIACDARQQHLITSRNVAAYAVGILKKIGTLEVATETKLFEQHPDPALEMVVIQA